jgi:DNA-damage-inducible protein J
MTEVMVMSTKSATIHARIEPELKEEVENILKQLGLNTTQAINLFYKQIKLTQGLPFEIKIPNQTTQQTFRDTDEDKNLVYCQDANDLFEKLEM